MIDINKGSFDPESVIAVVLRKGCLDVGAVVAVVFDEWSFYLDAGTLPTHVDVDEWHFHVSAVGVVAGHIHCIHGTLDDALQQWFWSLSGKLIGPWGL